VQAVRSAIKRLDLASLPESRPSRSHDLVLAKQEFRDGVIKGVEYALALGMPKVHCMAGYFPAGGNRTRHHAVYVENLRHAAQEFGKQAGRSSNRSTTATCPATS
jgi:hypothetical protein